MKTPRKKSTDSTLRGLAETLLKKQAGRLDGLSAWNAKNLIHELGTHQIELEMQNEELRRAQEELEAAGRKYADLYNFAPISYFSLDKRGVITEANLTAARLLGAGKNRLVGTSFSSFLATAVDRTAFFAHHAKVLSGSGIKAVCEVKLKRKGRDPAFVQLESLPVDGSDGAGDSVRTVVIDITERKQAEEAFLRYARHLVEMEEDIRRKLAAELHDELGRPLTLLGINFAMITEDIPEELQKKHGARIRDMRGLIEDASRIVRSIMAELRPPVLDDYGLGAALRWYCDLFSKRTGIAVKVRAAEYFPRLLPEKESALFRIAQESLLNVAKHAGASGVTLALERDGSKIRLSIADNGKGFDFRGGPATQRNSGWGLTIMRERALSAGGTFRLNSAPGKGTSILVEVPE